jgi:hypothetical protein
VSVETAEVPDAATELNGVFVGDLGPRTAPRRRKRRVVALAVVIVVLAAGVGYASTTDLWPGRKKVWDPAIEPLARFVENTRGGRFEEPVEVVFNSKGDYSEHFAIDRDEVDDETEAEAAHDLGILRALGFVAGDLDLFDTSETLGGSGTVGFFDPDDGRIHVRGERTGTLSASVRVTLVHELTHAYDFSHFELDVDEDEFANSGESFAYRAVVEGSAKLVEWEYLDSLTDAEQERYFAEGEEEAKGATADLEEVPEVFIELMGLPYALGPRFLQGLAAEEGSSASARKGVDRALRKWPTSEQQIADLDEYLEGKPPRKVEEPAVAAGEKRTDEPDEIEDFGQLSLALLLAPHVGAEAAWSAVEGWAGDAMTTYRVGKKGPPCIRIAVAFEDASHAGAFATAAQAWARTLPGAQVSSDDDLVRLQACDPGPDGPPVVALSGASVTEVVVARSDLTASLVQQQLPADAADCVAENVFARIGVAKFLELDDRLVADPSDSAAQQEASEVFVAAARDCGLQPPG